MMSQECEREDFPKEDSYCVYVASFLSFGRSQAIAAAAETFAKAMATLAETCGKKSLIKLGDKLYALICCDYIPGSLIAAHVAKFQSLYTSLKSALVSNEDMKVTSTMAGIFFLKSF